MTGRFLLYLFTLHLAIGTVFCVLAAGLAVFPDRSAPYLIALVPSLLGSLGAFTAVALVRLHQAARRRGPPESLDLRRARVVVGMTALDDEEPIGEAVRDFRSHPRVAEVVVIDNGSSDATAERARQAGAVVVQEPVRGFGSACMRALEEAGLRGGVLVLVEGDRTFRAADLDKMLPYLEHVDMVQGTRTTRELTSPDSQLRFWFNLGNQFVAKLLQIRFLGNRFTDVGCTYRVLRKECYLRIRPRLRVRGNHFLCHLLLEALREDQRIIEVPITFWRRVGRSKGVGGSYWRAFCNAARMCGLLYFR